jgi:hypothetical protein
MCPAVYQVAASREETWSGILQLFAIGTGKIYDFQGNSQFLFLLNSQNS